MLLGLIVAYAAILQAAYKFYLAPQFDYIGFNYRDPNWSSYVSVVCLVWLLSIAMPARLTRPSAVVLWLHFIIATAPTMLVAQYEAVISQTRALLLAAVVGLAWFGVVVLTSDRVRPTLRSQHVRSGLVRSDKLWLAMGAWSFLFIGYLLLVLQMSPRFVAFADVISVRVDYRETLTNSGSLIPYALILTSNVVNPALMIRGLVVRRWLPFMVGALSQIALYSVTGYKKTLLSVPVLLLVVWMFRRYRVSAVGLLGGVVFVMVASLLADLLFGTRALLLRVLMRALAAPGNLASAYTSIFWDLPDVRWSHSFLSWAFDYPYVKSPNFLVGSVVRGDELTSANVNLFGDGFMNFGWAGIFVECLVLVGTVWVLDNAGRDLPVVVPAAMCFVPTFALANSSVFTSLVSHGFLALIVLFVVLPRSGWGRHVDGAAGVPERAAAGRSWASDPQQHVGAPPGS